MPKTLKKSRKDLSTKKKAVGTKKAKHTKAKLARAVEVRPVIRVSAPRKAEAIEAPKPKPLTKELLELRAHLMDLLSALRMGIQQEVKGASERDLAHIIESSDIASDAAEGDLALRIAESEGAEATEIQKAIDKIDNGTYGSCESCNRPILVERLRFLPFATHCVKCQELAEIRRKEEGDELDDLSEGEEASDDN